MLERSRLLGVGACFRSFIIFQLFLCRLGWDSRQGVLRQVVSAKKGQVYRGRTWCPVECSYSTSAIYNLLTEVQRYYT